MSAPADLETLARDAAAWMKSRSAEIPAEVYLSRGEDRALARRDGAADGVEVSEHFGAAVRVLRGGRPGFAASAGATPESLRELYERAVAQAGHAEPGATRALPGPASGGEDPALAATLWDEALFSAPWPELEERLRAAEAAALSSGARRVLRAEYSESRGETAIAGTSGLFARERGGSASVSLVAAAESGAEVSLGEGWRASRRAAGVDFAAAGREAGARAAAQLGAGRAPAGRRPVLFEPRVGAEFLELLADLLSAEEVQGHRSLLAGKLGRAVASSAVTLRDDPRRPGGLASARYDDEGLPTRDKVLVEKGVLREYFHDTATAAREGAASNACASRASYRSAPSPGPSNFYLVPGTATREALLAQTREGVLVGEVMGMHMSDPVSGAFSVGASGVLIENGRPGRPFKGAMISGSLLDLLSRVDAVASDLDFFGSHGAPTFRVSSLDLA